MSVRGYRTCVPSFVGYGALAIALTFPLVLHLDTAVPSDLGDPLLNTWIIWWNAHALPLTSAWWNAPAFFPAQGALAFSEHLLGLSVMTSPVQWLGGGPQLAYNVALLLSFPLSALGAWLLVYELTGRRDAAFIGGLLYGFAPYRIAHLPQIQILAAGWMPVALVGLHRYVREPRIRWLVLFATGWTMQALSNGYYMAFFSVLVGLWVVWFVRPATGWRVPAGIGLAWGASLAAVAPVLWTYRQIHEHFGFSRGLGEVGDFGADVAGLLDAAPALAVWGRLRLFHRPEGELFPGLTIVVLVVAGAIVFRRSQPLRSRPRLTHVRRAVAGLAVLTLLASLSAIWLGAWEARVFGLRLFSVSEPIKPLSESLVLFLAWVATSPRVVAAFERKSELGFYAVSAVAMWVLSLGPAPTVFGARFMHYGLYWLLMVLPGFDALRVPARFAMLTTLCLSVVGALLSVRVADRLRVSSQWVVIAVALGVGLDTWMTKMPLEQAPTGWPITRCLPAGRALLRLPLGNPFEDVAVMYRAMALESPVVNGYSGYSPPAYAVLQRALSQFRPDFLRALSAHGVGAVIVEKQSDPDGVWTRYVSSAVSAETACSDGGFQLYRLPLESPAPFSPDIGAEIGVAAIHSNVRPEDLARVRDGDLSTRWASVPSDQVPELTIDLGTVQPITAIGLALGGYPADFPPALTAEVSDGGERWIERWRGDVGPLAFAGAIRAPLEAPIVIPLEESSGRFIRLRPSVREAECCWSVAELHVFGARGPVK